MIRVESPSEANTKIEAFIVQYGVLRDRAGGRILSRCDLTMRDVAKFAANMSIVELVSDESWILRLNGTGHTEHASVDRTGHNVLETCSPDERALRRDIANRLFDVPCGLRATLTETFEDGDSATVDSTSLPLVGKQGERLLVTYGLLIQDIEVPFGERPTLKAVSLADYQFVDIGYGTSKADTA